MSVHLQSASVQEAIEQLAAVFTARFPAQVKRPRVVGREAEFPVVDAQGRAADVRRLWEALAAPGDLTPKVDSGNPNLIVGLDGETFSYALEVGVGTVEINTRPCDALAEIETIMLEATARLVRAAAAHGWLVLGYGVQPVTPPTLSLMSPKQRYQSLYRAMGDEWLWYAVTASDQTQVDVGRDELVHMLNFGNLMAPVIIALCANSPVYGGALSPYCSGREGQMAAIHASEHRHGMPARPYASIADYVATVSQSTYLIRREHGEVLPSSHLFTEYLAEHGADFDAFLFHEHYIWNSARLRVAYGTIELRPACQQPWREQMAATALNLGLIEASHAIDAYVQEALGPGYWEIMRTYHRQAIRRGLAAPQPAPGFLAQIVELAEAGLRARGRGEERYLAPILGRLARGENPAQRARRIFQTDGLQGLIAHTAIRPEATTRPAGS
ncbi:MAG TPA: glutamate-cysteine ligase family protein [Caldilineaceae bacterium]|nr:glutamate-cysteine ligase family protein [Caldilineaceae bacterium]